MATTTDPERGATRGLELAYRYLDRRDRTRAQVAAHLESRDVPAAAIDEALETLERQGYLDDARYARTFAEDRRSLDGWGPERIERALLGAGIAHELVGAAVGTRDSDEELEAALELLGRRFDEVPGDDRERASALGLLVRKGYCVEFAYDAVRAFERAGGR